MIFLSKYVTSYVLELTYKMYVRPHLDYGDVIYPDQTPDMMAKLESIQYQAGLIVSKCWKGTIKIKLYKELGWESLAERRIFRRFSLYYKIINDHTPKYLKEHIKIRKPNITNRFSKSFFPFCQLGWEGLKPKLKNARSVQEFKKLYKIDMVPPKKGFFLIQDRYGTGLLFKLRVDFSDLRSHIYNHKFNCPSSICKCQIEEETTQHYLTRCPLFQVQRSILLNDISRVLDNDVTLLQDDHLSNLLIYGSPAHNTVTNKLILESTIRFIKESKRFKVIEAFS